MNHHDHNNIYLLMIPMLFFIIKMAGFDCKIRVLSKAKWATCRFRIKKKNAFAFFNVFYPITLLIVVLFTVIMYNE